MVKDERKARPKAKPTSHLRRARAHAGFAARKDIGVEIAHAQPATKARAEARARGTWTIIGSEDCQCL